MDINFAPPAEFVELAEKTKAFVIDKVIPYEKDPRWTSHGPTDELRIELNELARQAGVFAPHVAKEFGGRGLGQVGRALVFEAAGYSILGPMAVHCASPDEGNIHLLDHVARPDQRQHFLSQSDRHAVGRLLEAIVGRNQSLAFEGLQGAQGGHGGRHIGGRRA